MMCVITEKPINTSLSYTVDLKENVFKWLECGSQLKVFGVHFDAVGIAVNYNFVLSKCLFEANRREQLDSVIG
jgi:hypothetical protein